MHIPLYRLVETTPPAEEPVTLAELKTHLRISHSAEDAFISTLITTARQMCETFTGRSFVSRTYTLFLDRWPSQSQTAWWDGVRDAVLPEGSADTFALPRPPLAGVTSVKTYDEESVATTYAVENYYTDTAGARIVLKSGSVPPSATRAGNGIEIVYTAGYGAASAVPGAIKHAVKKLATHLYEHRGDGGGDAAVISGAALLLQPYRVAGLV